MVDPRTTHPSPYIYSLDVFSIIMSNGSMISENMNIIELAKIPDTNGNIEFGTDFPIVRIIKYENASKNALKNAQKMPKMRVIFPYLSFSSSDL